ncbi:succinylglutamate-semialdehyde dehydrogenase [Glaciimonas sp. GG7]
MHNHYINGKWKVGSGLTLPVFDPSTGLPCWSGAAATQSEVDEACSAARKAFKAWALTSPDERLAICQRFRDLLEQHTVELAGLISLEVGKPLWEARAEVATMAAKIEVSAKAYRARTGESTAIAGDAQFVVRHRPHGVMAVFGPYNFPGHLPNGHIVPALLAGNTIVFKPSEYAPQTAIRTLELWIEAGLPAGVMNLINGGRETGAALAANMELDGILFTGSWRTGRLLHQQFAGRPSMLLALEMGGNNPLVAWDIENVDAAVHHIVLSAFVSAGQRCTCARRLIVPATSKGNALLERLVEVTSQIRIGRFDASPVPFMGPVVSSHIATALLEAQENLVRAGGRSLLTMRSLQEGTGFVSPGIVDVTAARGIPDEEWFGPLLQVSRVSSFEDAIDAANATDYGLAAGLLSDSEAHWAQFGVQVRAGVVNWNRPTTGASSAAPFGGVGHSGNHRPSAYYAADYCAYPVASMESITLELPPQLSPGLSFERMRSE